MHNGPFLLILAWSHDSVGTTYICSCIGRDELVLQEIMLIPTKSVMSCRNNLTVFYCQPARFSFVIDMMCIVRYFLFFQLLEWMAIWIERFGWGFDFFLSFLLLIEIRPRKVGMLFYARVCIAVILAHFVNLSKFLPAETFNHTVVRTRRVLM